MSNILRENFEDYSGSLELFNKFHNQVINMPRDSFSSASLDKLRSLSAYLLLIKDTHNIDFGNNYKEIMRLIIVELKKQDVPAEFKVLEYEQRYFRTDIDFDVLYELQGRMFRHLMELCAFFGMIQSLSRQRKLINFDICNEYYLSDATNLKHILRNNLLSLNICENDYIKSLQGINVTSEANYKPAYAILRYLKEIKRKATIFEISILLGRIDDVYQDFDSIFKRALNIGSILPTNQEQQIKYFFGSMDWKNNDGRLYTYNQSQEPYFKFKTFILFMDSFDLIKFDSHFGFIELTQYSEDFLKEEIPLELLDLENLLYRIDDDTEKNAILFDLIIRKRSSYITEAIQKDSRLVEKINLRSLRSPEYDDKGKRKRNRIVAEIAKILADYTCEATGKRTFRTPNGLYYVEAHHIIEFNTEDGPDITENLIALGPEKHKLLHFASIEEIDDLYSHLKAHGVLNVERFIRMHDIYKSLTVNHINILYSKKIISSIDKEHLIELVKS